MKWLLVFGCLVVLSVLGSFVVHLMSSVPDVGVLSFDVELSDSPEDVREVLSILDDSGIKATFFVLGEFAVAHPDVVRETSGNGHEVGCHSYSHPRLTMVDNVVKFEEIQKCKVALEAILGKDISGFRAPYLSIDKSTFAVLEDLGFVYDSSVVQNIPFYPSSSLNEVMVSSNYFVPLMDYAYFNILRETDAFFYHMSHTTGKVVVVDLHPHIIMKENEQFHETLSYMKSGGTKFLTCEDFLAAGYTV